MSETKEHITAIREAIARIERALDRLEADLRKVREKIDRRFPVSL